MKTGITFGTHMNKQLMRFIPHRATRISKPWAFAVLLATFSLTSYAGTFDFGFNSVSNYGQLILTVNSPVNVLGYQTIFDTAIKSEDGASLRFQGTNSSTFGRFSPLLNVGAYDSPIGTQDLKRTNTYFTLDLRVENSPSIPVGTSFLDIYLYTNGTPSSPGGIAARFFRTPSLVSNTGPVFLSFTQDIIQANGSIGAGYVSGDTNALKAVRFIEIRYAWSGITAGSTALDVRYDNFQLVGPAVIPEPGSSALLLGAGALLLLRDLRGRCK